MVWWFEVVSCQVVSAPPRGDQPHQEGNRVTTRARGGTPRVGGSTPARDALDSYASVSDGLEFQIALIGVYLGKVGFTSTRRHLGAAWCCVGGCGYGDIEGVIGFGREGGCNGLYCIRVFR